MSTSVARSTPGRPIGRPALSSVPVLLAVAGLVVLLLAITAGPAGAHAAVRSTTPFDGERIAPDEVPTQVTISFNEDVVAPPDAIRVFDGSGTRVDVDDEVVGEDERTVGRALGVLEPGGHVVTWSVVSTDGHPIRGAFVFTIGDGPAVSDELVAAVFGGGSGIVGPLQVATTGITYVAVLGAAGAVLTALLLRRRGSIVELPGWVRTATLVGIGVTVLVVPLQAAAASGDGLAAALVPAQLGDALVGSVGVAAVARLAGLVLLLVGSGSSRAVGAIVALGSFLVDGHTRTVDPAAVVVAADTAHLLAGAVWGGGLALLVGELRARRLADDPVGGARLVGDWSALATVAVVGVVLAGSALSWAMVRTPDALTTTYGTTLVVKVALALLVVALGAYNHVRVVPAIERAVVVVPAGGSAAGDVGTATGSVGDVASTATVRTEAGWQRLRATVRLEVGVLVAVLAVTGWLQGQRPAAEELGIGGTFVASEQLTDDLTVDVVVDPNVAGLNTIHLYVLDGTGRTVSGIEGATLLLSLPDQDIGPIERRTQVAGPGHWTTVGRELAVPGTWEIEVVVAVDRFTEESVTVRTVVGAP